ncbi:MAG TPA: hypothetical protein VL068_05985, partial [Microthrixaceae bacterium]|nr:hypothetical protein [Microthrixaceae bacterium]
MTTEPISAAPRRLILVLWVSGLAGIVALLSSLELPGRATTTPSPQKSLNWWTDSSGALDSLAEVARIGAIALAVYLLLATLANFALRLHTSSRSRSRTESNRPRVDRARRLLRRVTPSFVVAMIV